MLNMGATLLVYPISRSLIGLHAGCTESITSTWYGKIPIPEVFNHATVKSFVFFSPETIFPLFFFPHLFVSFRFFFFPFFFTVTAFCLIGYISPVAYSRPSGMPSRHDGAAQAVMILPRLQSLHL